MRCRIPSALLHQKIDTVVLRSSEPRRAGAGRLAEARRRWPPGRSERETREQRCQPQVAEWTARWKPCVSSATRPTRP